MGCLYLPLALLGSCFALVMVIPTESGDPVAREERAEEVVETWDLCTAWAEARIRETSGYVSFEFPPYSNEWVTLDEPSVLGLDAFVVASTPAGRRDRLDFFCSAARTSYGAWQVVDVSYMPS